jgi:saccharopine dehydrogenase-like NADP-dependent oxidoreductase
MKKILIFGAGRSSIYLIEYLLDHAQEGGWKVVIADINLESAIQRLNGHPSGMAISLDTLNESARKSAINEADLVISLMPPNLHQTIAEDCLEFGKNLLTASYISPNLSVLKEKVMEKGLIFLGEMGLDPGIDHMSAMEKIHDIQSKGGKVVSFKSYTGGLVAPESDDNPWNYKISWNPKNVVLAGQGIAQFLEHGAIRYLPYNRIFKEVSTIQFPELGDREVYANRNSLSYIDLYGLNEAKTVIRGTIRHPGFIEAWDAICSLGFTDDTTPVLIKNGTTYSELTCSFLGIRNKNPRLGFAEFLGINTEHIILDKIEWLGLFSDEKILGFSHDGKLGYTQTTIAEVLQNLMVEKWKLNPSDKDLILMQHEFIYELNGKIKKLYSSLILKGEDHQYTAMAKTVGLPLAIFAKLLMSGLKYEPGIHIPLDKWIYEPVLRELEKNGIQFIETEEELAF